MARALDEVVRIAIAGSSGSIGTQTIDVVRAEASRYEVVGLGVGSSVETLIAQAKELKPRFVAVGDSSRRAEVAAALPDAPLIGAGGIADAEDARSFLAAGATAVQVGTANFVDPFVWPKLLAGITAYLERHGIARVADLVGTVQTKGKAAPQPSCNVSS